MTELNAELNDGYPAEADDGMNVVFQSIQNTYGRSHMLVVQSCPTKSESYRK